MYCINIVCYHAMVHAKINPYTNKLICTSKYIHILLGIGM